MRLPCTSAPCKSASGSRLLSQTLCLWYTALPALEVSRLCHMKDCLSKPDNTLLCQGGAISYAAAVASAYGVRACIVTAAGPDADLSVFKGHELHVVPAQKTLTFEHSYTWWGARSAHTWQRPSNMPALR